MSANIFKYIRDVDEFIKSVFELKGIQLNRDLSSVTYSQKYKTFTTWKVSEDNKNGVTMRSCDLRGLYGEGEKPSKELRYFEKKEETDLKPLGDLTELFQKAKGKNLELIAEKETKQYRGIDLELLASEGVFKVRDLKEVFETLELAQRVKVQDYFREIKYKYKADLILPIYVNGQLVNIQLRNSNRSPVVAQRKVVNLAGRKIYFRGLDALKDTPRTSQPVLIVEGDFEYFTCLQHGYRAIATNSISNVNKLSSILKDLKEQGYLKNLHFVVCFNKDKPNMKGAIKSAFQLKDNLLKLGLRVEVFNQFKHDEDLNDMQMLDNELTANFLRMASTQRNLEIKGDYIEAHLLSQIPYNSIITAPLSAGKTTATVDLISTIETKKEFVIVVPTIQLVKQVEDKLLERGENARAVYSKQEIGKNGYQTVKQQLIRCWKDSVRVIVMTHATFSNNLEDFCGNEDVNIILDEAHKLINIGNEKSVLKAIQEKKLKNYKLITATPTVLEASLPFVARYVLRFEKEKRFNRKIEVYDVLEHNLQRQENKAVFILNKFKQLNKKIVVHYNNKTTAGEIKLILESKGLRVRIYNANSKQVQIVNEYIKTLDSSEWDVLICTSSLCEGVSFYDDVYSLFIVTPQDQLDNVPQFLGRNRNTDTTGGIICSLKNKTYGKNAYIFLTKRSMYLERTDLNLTKEEAILMHSKMLLNRNCSIDLLIQFLRPFDMEVKEMPCIEEVEEGKALEKLVVTEEEAREKWINKKYINSRHWQVANKLFKLFKEGSSDPEEKIKIEIIKETIGSFTEDEFQLRMQFWRVVITNRQELKIRVKERIKQRHGKDLIRSTDNVKLLEIIKRMIDRGEIEGKKNFQAELIRLLENTLNHNIIKKNIDLLLGEHGYRVVERRARKQRFYKLEKV